MNQDNSKCPCGSERQENECCLRFLKGLNKPSTAEELMRARYTAFVRGDVDFIVNTHHSRTLKDVKREEIEAWSKTSEWLGLTVIKTHNGQASDPHGVVTFRAQYRTEGKMNDHWEHALFEKENGEWRFLDAQAVKGEPIRRTEPKVGRNDPCSCGSGKKSKKCCGT